MINADKSVHRATLVGKIWPDLTRRLLFIICITIIPINMLAVLVSSLVLLEARESQVRTLQNDYLAFMNRKEAMISELDNWSAEFILDHTLVLSLQGGSSSILSIGMAQELGRIINVYGIKGFAFLQEQNEGQRLIVKGNNSYYSFTQMQTLKQGLNNEKDNLKSSRDWQLYFFNDRYYLCRVYAFLNYTICFGIDIMSEFGAWSEDMPAINETVILSDGQVTLMNSSGNSWHAISDDQKNQYISVKDLSVSITSWHSDELRGELTTWMIDRRSWSSIPIYYWVLLVFAVISVVAIAALWHLVRRQVIMPLNTLQTSMKQLKDDIQQHRIEKKAETRDFKYIFDSFNEMADEITKAHEQEILMVKTEIVNLRLQVNPHMLLNSLNVVHSLAQSKNFIRIQEFTRSLANYFQYVLRENNRLVSVESEIRFVFSYIEIQKTRFPDEFISKISIEDEAAQAKVPPLLIENFVENAMKYARRSDRPIEVLISARRDSDKLVVTVDDNGKGMESAVVQQLNCGEIIIDSDGQKHLGVWNCRRRLQLFFGQAASLHIESQPSAGTHVRIEMPFITAAGREGNEPADR